MILRPLTNCWLEKWLDEMGKFHFHNLFGADSKAYEIKSERKSPLYLHCLL